MARRTIGKLSRGYRQRVGIAQAVIHKPKVLVLDEPTVGLDPRQIVEIRSLIRALAGQTTVLLSTHILPEVSIACRRVLILDQGKLVAEDTAEGLAQKTIGRGETVVRLMAPEREAVAVFGGLHGVVGVEVTAREPSGVLAITVTSRGSEDLRPRIAETAVTKGWKVFELAPRIISLEDLFVQILEDAEAKRA